MDEMSRVRFLLSIPYARVLELSADWYLAQDDTAHACLDRWCHLVAWQRWHMLNRKHYDLGQSLLFFPAQNNGKGDYASRELSRTF